MIFAICLIALVAGFVHLRWRGRRRVEIALAAILALTVSISGWSYFRSNLHTLADGDRIQVHLHDFAHYFLGSKYFPELGYQGLYLALAAALEDLRADGRLPANELTRIETVRDLAEKNRGASATEIAARSALLRGSFSPQRWRAFTDDIGYLARARPDFDWRVFVRDFGFNPSPAWTVLGWSAASLLPIDRAFQLLLWLDRILLLVVGLLLFRFLGAVPALFAATLLFVFPPGHFSTSIWTDGSFLRQTWLVWLAAAWILLQRGRFSASGLFFGVAAMERVFPVFFFAGALWSFAGTTLIPPSFQRRSAVPPHAPAAEGERTGTSRSAVRLLAGFACGVLALGVLSTAMFGPKCWSDFAANIKAHSGMFFTNHIGLQKAGTYSPELTAPVNSVNAPDPFRSRSSAFSQRWKRWRLNLLVQALVVLAALAAASRLPRVLASAFVGSALLFALSMPAHYYLVYFSLWAAFLLVPEKPPPGRGLETAPPQHVLTYLGFAGLVVVVEALLLAPLPQLQAIAFTCFTLLFFFLATSAGLLLRPRAAFATCCGLLAAGGFILHARAVPLSNRTPPPELGAAGERLIFEPSAQLRPAALKTMDSYGYPVDDTGFFLPSGNVVSARFLAAPGGAASIVLRSDQAAKGYLEATVNRRWRDRSWVRQTGTLGYLQFKPPPEALVPGSNMVELSWSGTNALAVFSAWVTR